MKPITIVFSIVAFSFHGASGQAIFRRQLIFPLQEKHVHSSSIVECPDGSLLACWYYGSGERKADDVLIQGSRLKKGSRKWEPVFLMADTPGFPDCNPVLFIDRSQRLWLFWVTVLAHRWEKSLLKYRRSRNYQGEGAPKWDWQETITLAPGAAFAKRMKDAFTELIKEEPMWAEYAPPYAKLLLTAAQDAAKRQVGWMTRTHPLTLPSGRILLPLYSDGFNVSLIAISDDDGDTWRASLPIVGFGPIQPTLVPRQDGTLVAYLRDAGLPPNRVMRSVSRDHGQSWSLAEDTDIPNPGSSLEVIVLRDGTWLMAFNDTERGRHSLAVALSDDEGKSWKWKRKIAVDTQKKKSYAYPSLVQTKDGRLHLTFSDAEKGGQSIQHVVFNKEWIGDSEK